MNIYRWFVFYVESALKEKMKTFHLIYKCKLIKNIFTGVVILHRIGSGFSRLTEHFGKQAFHKKY